MHLVVFVLSYEDTGKLSGPTLAINLPVDGGSPRSPLSILLEPKDLSNTVSAMVERFRISLIMGYNYPSVSPSLGDSYVCQLSMIDRESSLYSKLILS